MPQPPNNLREFSSLVQIVRDLRGPEGCPWDKEQTHQSLAPYALEEAAELQEAILEGNPQEIIEESGDVMFQALLHGQLLNEENRGDIFDIIEVLNKKLIRRHPHVFSATKVANTDEVIRNWAAIKAQEKGEVQRPTHFIEIPSGLPALQAADKIGQKTKKQGFDWNTPQEVLKKVREEVDELEAELKNGDTARIEEELGDVFFSLVQLARHLHLQSEGVLKKNNRKFLNRYHSMLNICESKGLNWDELSSEQKEGFWVQAKELERKGEAPS